MFAIQSFLYILLHSNSCQVTVDELHLNISIMYITRKKKRYYWFYKVKKHCIVPKNGCACYGNTCGLQMLTMGSVTCRPNVDQMLYQKLFSVDHHHVICTIKINSHNYGSCTLSRATCNVLNATEYDWQTNYTKRASRLLYCN